MKLPLFRRNREGRERRRQSEPLHLELLEDRVVPTLTAVGSEIHINTTTALQQLNPAVAVDPNGDAVVAFQSGDTNYNQPSSYDIKARRFNTSGVGQGNDSTVNTVTTDLQFTPAVAIDSTGDFVVAWASYTPLGSSNRDVFAQRFNAAGVKQGGQITVNTTITNGQVLPTVAMDPNGNFVIAWASNQSDQGDIIFQQFDAAGVRQGPETQANNTANGNQTNPTVAVDSSGNFVIAWQDSSSGTTDIRFRRFNSSGNAFAGDTVANTSSGSQLNPGIAMQPNGQFVITWDGNGPSDSQGIFFRRYNASGVAQDSTDVRANSTTGATAPSIGISSSGDFAIAWTNNDTNGTGIFAQQFFSTGARSGAEFRVNTTTANNQSEASVGSNADGDVFIVWRSQGQEGTDGDGIYGQEFQTDLHAPTTIGIANINVNEDAANTVINLVNNFNDQEDGATGLTYTITGNTNPGLFTSVSINNSNANHPLTFDYAPNANGASTITITATDTSGLTITTTFTVTLNAVSDAPTINAISNLSINQNAGPQTVNLAGITSGPSNESVQTISVTATSDNAALIPNPVSVTYISPSTTGLLSFTPVAGQFGVAHITVTVKDNGGTTNGGTDTTTRTFTVTVDGVPTANGQSVTTNLSTPKAITLTGSDPENESLTYVVTANAAHGTLSGTAPNLTYTPNAGYLGIDSFQFTVNDGRQSSNPATVNITILGAPTANSQSVSVAHDTAKPITLTGSDPNSPPRPLTYIVTANSTHGTLSGTAPNLTYTPNAGYQGTDSFQFKVNNGSLDSNIATISIDVAPPTLQSIAVTPANPSVAKGLTQQFTATGTYSDNSTQDLTSQVTWASATPTVATITAAGLATAVSAGTSTISATLSGVTGSTTLMVTADTIPPQVIDILVHFGSQMVSVLNLNRSLPWINIDAIDVVFSEDVLIDQADLTLTGIILPAYSTNGFSYNPTIHTARWNLPTPLGIDRLMLTVDGDTSAGVRDTNGNFLSGGDFLKALTVLPGDFNGDGVVTIQDATGIRNQLPGFGSVPTVFGDLDGDGDVDTDDYNQARRRIGTRLP